ncbi:DUF1648 domain-containing protein [Sphaerisporangium fuscum]|uniref:DUF1648 domain-containing protein n=1 Tax=Sphaerisporangium fuscum TaxID=2835868 RepID=UPI001BDD1372|nr:DUF1648 domain-containing protein [Sphaerisporangium fuscum]
MTDRPRFVLLAGAWFVAVTVVLVAVPLALRDRLPEPLATHWGLSGRADRAMSFGSWLALVVVLWALIAGFAMYRVVRPAAGARRVRMRPAAALLAGAGAAALGLQWAGLAANLGRPDWRDAGPLGWQTLLVVAAAILAGTIGRLVVPSEPEDAAAAEVPGRRLRLRAGQRAVWISSASNPWSVGLAAAGLLGALVLAATGLTVPVAGATVTAGPLAFVGVVGLALSRVGVRVSDKGLVISFGPLAWPRRTVALGRIQSARAEDRRPSEVGGWGFRGLPGMSTIMIRGGECLVVRYSSGGEIAVSVDDAERGAALLNTLVAERTAAR